MAVHDRLACGVPAVHSDVVPIGRIVPSHQPFTDLKNLRQVCLLLWRQVKIIPSEPIGEDEKMSLRRRIPIPDDKEIVIPVEDPVCWNLQKYTHGCWIKGTSSTGFQVWRQLFKAIC
jgi:hypothetical protein